jgi:hypothetical protein
MSFLDPHSGPDGAGAGYSSSKSYLPIWFKATGHMSGAQATLSLIIERELVY